MRYAGLVALSAVLLAAGHEKTASPRVVIVRIPGPLDAAHVALVARAARLIKAERPALAVFEIDTPGGRIDHMLRIGEEIMGLSPTPTAAYVRPLAEAGNSGGAWSAGAYLALSCRRLYMHPGTVIGAAAPVQQTGEGVQNVDEKYVSAFREKFRARAEQNGYPANLAVAMVDKDLELFQVTVDGRRLYLTAGEIESLTHEGRTIARSEVPYIAKGKLLTLTDRQVVATGMGRIAEARAAIYADFALVSPTEHAIEPSWSESLVGLLTSPIVALILLAVGMLGIWIEFKTPGFGAPGLVGILAIGLVLFGHHLAGLAEATEILLVVIGLVLIAVEIFVVPGTFVAAIAGILCVVAGIILSLQDFALPDPRNAPWQVDILLGSLGRVLYAFVGATLAFLVVLRFLPKVPFVGRLVLQTELAGTTWAPAASGDLVGRMGHAITMLRPAGKVELDGEVYDVVSEGDLVGVGEPVEVAQVEGMRIVVAKVKR